jgi:protein-L-isoaspartate O-methyltransferase
MKGNGVPYERKSVFRRKLPDWIRENSAGSGYMTACLQELVGPNGKVVGVEVYKMLVDHSRIALERWHKGVLDSGNIVLLQGNALRGAALLAGSCSFFFFFFFFQYLRL